MARRVAAVPSGGPVPYVQTRPPDGLHRSGEAQVRPVLVGLSRLLPKPIDMGHASPEIVQFWTISREPEHPVAGGAMALPGRRGLRLREEHAA